MSVNLNEPGRIRDWHRTFFYLSRDMASDLAPRWDETLGRLFDACVALTDVYPEGATKPPAHIPAGVGELNRTSEATFRHEGSAVEMVMRWPMDYAEYERLGTRRSIPPVLGDNIPNETKRAAAQHAEHDFLRPIWDAEDVGMIEDEFSETWDSVWR